VRPLITIYTTPGFTDERIHLFLATGLAAGTARPEADEFVEPRILPWSEVLAMARRGEIQDGKTLCALGAMRSAKG
jgi:ADP-ribose pyrophosphatase